MRGWERSGQAAFNGLVLYVLSLVPGLVLFCAMVTVIPLAGIGVGLAVLAYLNG
ncbi:hypothetical protein [Thermomonospora amylolytica]|uniref:hypothetical protein n=1 Tax=Thermomonospora amylolytica TaxID=1411117 RepID=UPI0013003EA5|nr:hypothetical protein [Thermomonospora amylolytica]